MTKVVRSTRSRLSISVTLPESSTETPPEGSQTAALLAWYDVVRRDLPWRRSRDPYRVLLSEVMLQQTRVETVVPYFEAFVRAYPTVEALASAPLADVLARWSGLGYYRRARGLHAAAREVVRRGGFPADPAGLAELPGVGSYTVAAVASIAFGRAVPVLDGNVARVTARLLTEAGDPARRAVRERLLARAAELLDPARPGDSNQALMELGATVCRPRAPRCGECPLAIGCRGRASGEPERFPPPRRRREVEQLELAAAVVEQGGRVLLFRRPEGSDLLAGMWELPHVPHATDRRRLARSLAARYGGRWRLAPSRARVRQGITYRRVTVHLHAAELDDTGTIAEGPEAAWAGAAERAGLALPALVTKALDAFAATSR